MKPKSSFLLYGIGVLVFLVGTVISVHQYGLRHDENYFLGAAGLTIALCPVVWGIIRGSMRDGLIALGLSIVLNALFWAAMTVYWVWYADA